MESLHLSKDNDVQNRLQQRLDDYEHILNLLDIEIACYQKNALGDYIITFGNKKCPHPSSDKKTLKDIFGEPLSQGLKVYYDKAFNNKEVKDHHFQFKDRYYSLTLSPFKYNKAGEVTEILSETTDITKQYLSEEQHHQKTEFLNNIIQSNPYSIQILDATGHHMSHNQAFFDLFQAIPNAQWSILEDPMINEHYGDQLKKVLTGEIMTIPAIWYNAHNIAPIFSDKLICTASVIFPLFLNKKISNIIVMHEDITLRVDAENALKEAKERAEESDRLKSAFLANMSHEIRTPMNSIIGFTQLLEDYQYPQEEHLEFIDMIKKSSEDLLVLINNIIDISKIEAKQITITTTQVNINHKIRSLYSFFIPQIKQKEIEFSINTPLQDNQAMITTDQEKLQAILVNLINNAIKFTPSGSIEIGYTLKGTFIEFYVHDTGIGISQDKQKAVFDRFVQVDSRLNREYKGSGLGLSISQGYIKLLGGTIRFSSEVGKGSSFYVTLPLSEARA